MEKFFFTICSIFGLIIFAFGVLLLIVTFGSDRGGTESLIQGLIAFFMGGFITWKTVYSTSWEKIENESEPEKIKVRDSLGSVLGTGVLTFGICFLAVGIFASLSRDTNPEAGPITLFLGIIICCIGRYAVRKFDGE